MSVSAYLLGLVVGVTVFIVLDFMWLLILARESYQKHLGYLLAAKPKPLPVLLFYTIFILALQYLVISPYASIEPTHMFLRAGAFGLACYATYNMSNWATIKKWPARIVVLDMLWGVFVTLATTGAIMSVFKVLNIIKITS
jgi:uncharacterized membrane protein